MLQLLLGAIPALGSIAKISPLKLLSVCTVLAGVVFGIYNIYTTGYDAGNNAATTKYQALQLIQAENLQKEHKTAIKKILDDMAQREKDSVVDRDFVATIDETRRDVEDSVKETIKTVYKTKVITECRNVPDDFIRLLNDTVRAGTRSSL